MAQLVIEQIPLLGDNYAYLLHEPGASVTGVVDAAVAAPVLERLRARGWKLDWILTTHHHADHTGGNLELKQATGCRVAGAKADEGRIPGIDLKLAEGDRFKLGEAEAQVLETPGHTSGHISFWFPEAKALFCADTLFSLGCGRVIEGSHAQMWNSLSKLAALPDDTLAYCGHEYTQANARFALSVDPDNPALKARAAEVERLRAAGRPTVPSTLAAERAANPFLRAGDPAIRAKLGMQDASDAEVFAEIRRRKDRF
ncbi:MAG TPA: hydroxyacylglutathione hydrolase [Geminicoccaceae bacterium]|nr:hydroxyacylglutathione hydrolase [Geminicoccaceae bacterium]